MARSGSHAHFGTNQCKCLLASLPGLGQSGVIPGAEEGVNPTQTIWLRMKRDEIPKGKIKFPQCEKLGIDNGEASTNAHDKQHGVSKVVTLSCLMCGDSNGDLLNSLAASTMSLPPENCHNHWPPLDREKFRPTQYF